MGTIIMLSILSIIISLVSIGIIISLKIQMLQRKKYNEIVDIVNGKKEAVLEFKDGLTKEDINNIDSTIDVDSLMEDLYNTFLNFEDNLRSLNENFDNILTGYIKDFYSNKVSFLKENKRVIVTDNISLIGYSITEFSKKNLKFKIHISCINYKMIENNIVGGSNSYLVEQILLLSYEKVNNKWLISSYDKVYEKKMG